MYTEYNSLMVSRMCSAVSFSFRVVSTIVLSQSNSILPEKLLWLNYPVIYFVFIYTLCMYMYVYIHCTQFLPMLDRSNWILDTAYTRDELMSNTQGLVKEKNTSKAARSYIFPCFFINGQKHENMYRRFLVFTRYIFSCPSRCKLFSSITVFFFPPN